MYGSPFSCVIVIVGNLTTPDVAWTDTDLTAIRSPGVDTPQLSIALAWRPVKDILNLENLTKNQLTCFNGDAGSTWRESLVSGLRRTLACPFFGQNYPAEGIPAECFRTLEEHFRGMLPGYDPQAARLLLDARERIAQAMESFPWNASWAAQRIFEHSQGEWQDVPRASWVTPSWQANRRGFTR